MQRRGGLAASERWRRDPELHPHRLASVKGECIYCFQPATTYDHVIPRGRPGWDEPGNLVPACLSCNGQKGQRTPDEWLAAQEPRS
ncbi:MAG: HNH endonuclease [Chloroflexota bacterium]